jgi:glutamine synthetase
VHKVKGGTIRRLPRTLLEALEGFETDPLVASTFGEEFRDIYLDFKMKEWERSFYTVYAEEREDMLEFL